LEQLRYCYSLILWSNFRYCYSLILWSNWDIAIPQSLGAIKVPLFLDSLENFKILLFLDSKVLLLPDSPCPMQQMHCYCLSLWNKSRFCNCFI
jgi:hypothetical protein